MVRRTLLAIVLVGLGLALINAAAVRQVPRRWVPDILFTVQRYVGAEGAVVAGVFGLGLILIAMSPLRNRMWILLAVLYGALSAAVQVDRYYRGQGDVVPPIVFWVASTALLVVLFPIGGRRRAATTSARTAAAQPPTFRT